MLSRREQVGAGFERQDKELIKGRREIIGDKLHDNRMPLCRLDCLVDLALCRCAPNQEINRSCPALILRIFMWNGICNSQSVRWNAHILIKERLHSHTESDENTKCSISKH